MSRKPSTQLYPTPPMPRAPRAGWAVGLANSTGDAPDELGTEIVLYVLGHQPTVLYLGADAAENLARALLLHADLARETEDQKGGA